MSGCHLKQSDFIRDRLRVFQVENRTSTRLRIDRWNSLISNEKRIPSNTFLPLPYVHHEM